MLEGILEAYGNGPLEEAVEADLSVSPPPGTTGPDFPILAPDRALLEDCE